jgi:hypothetical protein
MKEIPLQNGMTTMVDDEDLKGYLHLNGTPLTSSCVVRYPAHLLRW